MAGCGAGGAWGGAAGAAGGAAAGNAAANAMCGDDDLEDCDKQLERENLLCEIEAGGRFDGDRNQAVGACRATATVRYSFCLRGLPESEWPPLTGVDTEIQVLAMDKSDILTNSFFVEYDEERRHLCVYTVNNGVKADMPIRLRMDSLLEKGKEHAAQWFGESIFLLIPSLRRELYDLDKEEL